MPDLGGFLLAFPALFSIVNPAGGALIFSQVMAERTRAERAALARRIAFYALLVLLVSLWAGSYVLSFFGITLAALRIAGGLVVATRAWSLLNAPETTQARKERQAEPARGAAKDEAKGFERALLGHLDPRPAGEDRGHFLPTTLSGRSLPNTR